MSWVKMLVTCIIFTFGILSLSDLFWVKMTDLSYWLIVVPTLGLGGYFIGKYYGNKISEAENDRRG